jgi:hypothetical protein
MVYFHQKNMGVQSISASIINPGPFLAINIRDLPHFLYAHDVHMSDKMRDRVPVLVTLNISIFALRVDADDPGR